ncbi:MAG: hypothetical protein WCB79_08640 [Halobacteriota archaeon]
MPRRVSSFPHSVDGRHGFKLTELRNRRNRDGKRLALLVEEVVRIRIVKKGEDL